MKYLKKYNEELRSSTYKKASEILAKKGHKRRASIIGDWAKVTKEKEDKEFIDNCKRLGVFEMCLYAPGNIMSGTQIVSRKGQLYLKGKFYLNFYFDLDSWSNNFKEWKDGDRDNLYLSFHLGLIPADEDTKLEMQGSDLINRLLGTTTDQVPHNGTYWIGAFDVEVTNTDFGGGIYPKSGLYLDTWEVKPRFADRKNAIKFINLIYGIFKGDIDHSSSVHSDTKEVIMDHLFDDAQITIEEFEELISSIKRTNVNKLYLD